MPEAVNRQKIKKLSAAMAAIPPICLKVLVILSAAEASLDGSEAGAACRIPADGTDTAAAGFGEGAAQAVRRIGAALAAMDPGAVTVEGG